ncbi:MAG: site-specific DNA-methyltransferase [Phycisphaerales bacterium]|nr:site-specific DNA-methyltransferase [Phycisphaerales bacterium]
MKDAKVVKRGSARSDCSPGHQEADGRIVCADNLSMMATLADASIDLVYIDPPFMTNTTRVSANGQNYEDRWRGGVDEYRAFLQSRLTEIHRLLKTSGSVYVHIDPRVSHHVRLMLDEIFGVGNFLNEVIWSYRTGGVSTKWFGRKHDTILVYAKSAGSHTFNVRREGAYRTDGLKLDEEGRPFKQTKKGRLFFNADGPALTDVWEIPFLSTVSLERTGYPTQKPEALLGRIIQASSLPGDLVADFFCGSGTTLAVAKRMGRKWLGCDESEEAVKIAVGRVGQVKTKVELG